MRIIIDGCDGVGKTTLAKYIASILNLDYCHCTYKDNISKEFYRYTLDKEDVIWDRHFVAELIYPEVFGRKQKLLYKDAKELATYCKENGIIYIILTASNDEIKNRLDYKGEFAIIKNNYVKINRLFCMYAKKLNIPLYNDKDFDKIVEFIIHNKREGESL